MGSDMSRIDQVLEGIQSDPTLSSESVLKSLKSIRKISEQTGYRYAEFLFRLAFSFYTSGNLEKGLGLIERSLELQDEESDGKLFAECLSSYGAMLTDIGSYEKSIEALGRALMIQRKYKDSRHIFFTYLRLGNAHRSFLRSHDKSIKFYLSALAIAKKLKDVSYEGLSYGSLANAYMYKKDFPRSRDSYFIAEEIFKRAGNYSKQCLALLGLGTVLRETGEFHKSISALKKGIRISHRIKNKELEVSLSINLAISYMMNKDESSFRKLFERSVSLIPSIREKTLASKLYQGLSEAFEECGKYKCALEYFKKYFELYSDIFREESDRVNKILRFKIEKDKTEKEIQLFRIKEQELQREIKAKTNELNAMASYLSQKNEFVKTFVENVKKDFASMKLEESITKFVNTVVRKAESASSVNEDLKRFESELDKFSYNFIENLSRKFPALSSVELRICSMIKINLSTREIANLMYLSKRTVENHKYRIAKKLLLRSGTNMVTFLNSV